MDLSGLLINNMTSFFVYKEKSSGGDESEIEVDNVHRSKTWIYRF